MEDLSRDVAQDLKGTGHRHKPETSKSWTLLLVGELGNIISLRLSRTLLVSFLSIFAVVCTFSIISSITYFSLRLENKTLRDNLNGVTSELLAANKAREASQVRLMLLEGKGKPGKNTGPEKQLLVAKKSPLEPKTGPANRTNNTEKSPPSSAKNDAPAAEKKLPSAFVTAEAARPSAVTSEPTGQSPSRGDGADENPDSESEESTAPDEDSDDEDGNDEDDALASVSAEDILVDKLEIWKQVGEQAIRFQFSLKNIGASGRKMKGYTFVVLKPGEGSSEIPRGSPWTPLKDGQPTIYKRGQFFSIARFKYVRGTVPQIQDVQRFETATIYVYTESGDLLIEKVFDVNDILRS